MAAKIKGSQGSVPLPLELFWPHEVKSSNRNLFETDNGYVALIKQKAVIAGGRPGWKNNNVF